MIGIQFEQECIPKEYRMSEQQLHAIEGYLSKLSSSKEGLLVIEAIEKERMQTLNRLHRGKDYVTDVLTFPYSHEDADGQIADIVISFDKVQEQAEHGVKRELVTMVVHGCLHALGYDHEEEHDAQIMFPLQETLVNQLL
ncbi:MAG: rRNA maturation RNase YbeY [bacterium]|nr:rRNA maturation RNase YbeY [bacterium]MDA1024532.1 rRNA maturation RNase YbeY [bacterium]